MQKRISLIFLSWYAILLIFLLTKTQGVVSSNSLSLICDKDIMEVGQVLTCYVSNCQEGFWILSNEEGIPLNFSFYSPIYDIPPDNLVLEPVDEGKIRIKTLCLEPSVGSKNVTIEVLPKDLSGLIQPPICYGIHTCSSCVDTEGCAWCGNYDTCMPVNTCILQVCGVCTTDSVQCGVTGTTTTTQPSICEQEGYQCTSMSGCSGTCLPGPGYGCTEECCCVSLPTTTTPTNHCERMGYQCTSMSGCSGTCLPGPGYGCTEECCCVGLVVSTTTTTTSSTTTTTSTTIPDTELLLSCDFDNTYVCDNGETPTATTGTSFATGYNNQGVYFDAVDYIDYSPTNNYNVNTGTVVLWYKPMNDVTPDTWTYFFNAYQRPARFNTLEIYYGKLRAAFCATGQYPDCKILETPRNWKAGEWVHVAVVWDRNNGATLYENGENIASFSETWGEINPDMLEIGNTYHDHSRGAIGTIDELRIFDRVLSQDEIRELMGRITTTTTTTSTSTTTTVEDEIRINCEKDQIRIGQNNSCSLEDCNEGLWVAKDYKNKPLNRVFRNDSTHIEFGPALEQGEILAVGICLDPEYAHLEKIINVIEQPTTTTTSTLTTTTSSTTTTIAGECRYSCYATCVDDNMPPDCFRRVSHGTGGCIGGTVCCESISKTCPTTQTTRTTTTTRRTTTTTTVRRTTTTQPSGTFDKIDPKLIIMISLVIFVPILIFIIVQIITRGTKL